MYIIIGRAQIFNPVPVPVPEKIYKFLTLSVSLSSISKDPSFTSYSIFLSFSNNASILHLSFSLILHRKSKPDHYNQSVRLCSYI